MMSLACPRQRFHVKGKKKKRKRNGEALRRTDRIKSNPIGTKPESPLPQFLFVFYLYLGITRVLYFFGASLLIVLFSGNLILLTASRYWFSKIKGT